MSELALIALGLGLLAASALLIGAILGLLGHWPDRLVAAIMAFGAGALISALAFELVAEGHERAGIGPVVIGFMLGAALFVLANQAINARGGFLRKPATLYRFLREQRRKHAMRILEHLSRVDLIRALPPEDAHGLVPFVESKHYDAGDVIFRQGDPGDTLYLIESGTVEVHLHGGVKLPTPPKAAPTMATGAAVAIAAATATVAPSVTQLGPGEAFGEVALLAGHPHHSSAVAQTDVHLWCVRKDRLELLEGRSPRLAATLEALRAHHLTGRSIAELASAQRGDERPNRHAARWRTTAARHLTRSQAATGTLTAHEHQTHVQQHAGGGAPTAIFLGALLDGIPESVVIGASLLTQSAFSPVFVIAVFLANLPEALSSSVGMRQQGYSRKRVVLLWGSLSVGCGLASLLGNVLLAGAPAWLIAGTEAVAAGGILAMLADTMMPEAFEQGGPFVALWTSLGFLAAFFLKTLAVP